jgi:hypothetical protein
VVIARGGRERAGVKMAMGPEISCVFIPLGYKFGSTFIPMSLLMDINLYPTGLWVRVCSYSIQTCEPVGF